MEAYVADARLLVGAMARSLKARDVERDPRCTLQSVVTDPDAGEPELKLYCHALPSTGEPSGAWWAGRLDAARVYALAIDEAALVEWEVAQGRMNVTSWSPERGLRRRSRRYP